MQLFDKYLNDFEKVIQSKVEPDSLTHNGLYFEKSAKLNESQFSEESYPVPIAGPKILFLYDRNNIESVFGKNPSAFEKISIGGHPDFSDLDQNQTINHHCTNVFIDIKGSTKLINKYTLPQIRLIKDSLLTLAINAANQFGGHVHRLQGDGIFLQFVRKNQIPNQSVINALNMTALLTYFVAHQLSDLMRNNDISPIKIRTGIDFGPKESVLWSHYGLPGCGELTTTSLHTDLAAKLQALAGNNSILIGGNVNRVLDLREEYIKQFIDKSGKVSEHYIINSNLVYPFFEFDWKKYLTLLPYFSNNSQNLEIIQEDNIYSLICYITENDQKIKQYFPNSFALEKKTELLFELQEWGQKCILKQEDQVSWRASNSGKEARDAGEHEHNFKGYNENKPECRTSAAYLGHHILYCDIKRGNNSDIHLKFPIFVL